MNMTSILIKNAKSRKEKIWEDVDMECRGCSFNPKPLQNMSKHYFDEEEFPCPGCHSRAVMETMNTEGAIYDSIVVTNKADAIKKFLGWTNYNTISNLQAVEILEVYGLSGKEINKHTRYSKKRKHTTKRSHEL